MLNHVTRYSWSLPYNVLRPSLIDRAAARKAHPGSNSAASEDDLEEAPRSRKTDANVRAAIETLETGKVGEFARSIGDVIRSWRADNTAGGRAIIEHLPLPNDLAKTVARLLDDLGEREKAPAFDNVISHLDPSVRMHVAQQVAGLMGRVSEHDVKRADARDLWFEPRQREVVEPRLREVADPPPSREVSRRGTRGYGEPLSATTGSGEPTPRRDRRTTDEAAEEARQRAADNASHLADYNDGRVAETVDEVIASSTWFERRIGDGGAKVRGKGRYVWTRCGWVDLQHVISAATVTPIPELNLALGDAQEGWQWIQGMKSGGKREDYLSNLIGARALAHQQRVGGTIGQAVAYVLAQYRPMTSRQADEFLRKGGQREDCL